MEAKRILMIDDDKGDTFLIKMLIEKGTLPLTFESMDDAEGALEVLLERFAHAPKTLPDMILLDINMPRMNGFEFQEALSKCKELNTIPVIFMTTSDSQSDVQRAYELGGNAYITKPSNLNGLKHILERLCDFWCNSVSFPSRSILPS